MRRLLPLLLPLLLLAACSPPATLFHPFALPANHHDVVWVLRDGILHRCWYTEQPVCMEARWLKAPGVRHAAPAAPAVTEPVEQPAKE